MARVLGKTLFGILLGVVAAGTVTAQDGAFEAGVKL